MSYKPLKISLTALILVISFKMLAMESAPNVFHKAPTSRQYRCSLQQPAQLQTQNLQCKSYLKKELHFNNTLLYIESLYFHKACYPRSTLLVNLDMWSTIPGYSYCTFYCGTHRRKHLQVKHWSLNTQLNFLFTLSFIFLYVYFL